MPSIFGVFAKGLILDAQCRGFSGTKSAFRGFTSLFDTWRFHHFTIKCFFTVNGFWNKNEVIIKMGRGHASLQNAQSLLIGPMNTHEDQTLGDNGKTASKRQNCLASCHVTQPEKKGCFGKCMPRAHRQRKNVPPTWQSHENFLWGTRGI